MPFECFPSVFCWKPDRYDPPLHSILRLSTDFQSHFPSLPCSVSTAFSLAPIKAHASISCPDKEALQDFLIKRERSEKKIHTNICITNKYLIHYLSSYSNSKLTSSICIFALISKNKHLMAECQASVAGGLLSGIVNHVGPKVCSEGEGVLPELHFKATFKAPHSPFTWNLPGDISTK